MPGILRLTRAIVLMALAAAANPDAFAETLEPVIETGDVDRFYEIYDAADGQPSAETLQEDYLEKGSDGLLSLARLRQVTGERIATAIQERPELYEDARECARTLPRVRSRLKAALRKLNELYPDARNPAVTIAVGRGKPVGIGYPDTGVQIGLEALCYAAFLNPDVEDRFVYVIAHEYIHVVQSPELVESTEENPTVLDISLVEGAAEFVGELISGDVAYGGLRGNVEGRETEIERAFLADKDKTDLSDWVYNSTPDQPGDLGYWVGYRIVKAYYQNSGDKRRALREILEMTDPDAFLEASGWRPGIALE
ncbi:DUF2268 domain-containing putative Zn-dependent protease [Euryhalocaulis caribicus]|uniref:gliding motility protein GldB-related protein n=1 Tax=Euryhalocaulis caribicus TaxID=1161401 RepID=UPI0003A06212|nr:DUF2268 domain-containing putative Zn-dependent protease [Euryhalocaulis caribicus]